MLGYGLFFSHITSTMVTTRSQTPTRGRSQTPKRDVSESQKAGLEKARAASTRSRRVKQYQGLVEKVSALEAASFGEGLKHALMKEAWNGKWLRRAWLGPNISWVTLILNAGRHEDVNI